MGRKISSTELEITKVQTVVSVVSRKYIRELLKDVRDRKQAAIETYDQEIAELQAILKEMDSLNIQE